MCSPRVIDGQWLGSGMSHGVEAVSWRTQRQQQRPRATAVRRISDAAMSTVATLLQTNNHSDVLGRCVRLWGVMPRKNGGEWLARTAATPKWIWYGLR